MKRNERPPGNGAVPSRSFDEHVIDIDEPFDEEQTGIRAKSADGLEVSVDPDGSGAFRLPSWEELTGIRRAILPTSRAGQQHAISLVEAARLRHSEPAGSNLGTNDGQVVVGLDHVRGGGMATVEYPDRSLDWVERFEDQMDSWMAGAEADEAIVAEKRDPRPAARTPVSVPPPPIASRISSAPPPPPTARRPNALAPSSIPPLPALPRFKLGPQIEGLLGRDSPRPSAPSSLAPVAAEDAPATRERANPWLAATVGALVAIAAALAIWAPTEVSPRVASLPAGQPAFPEVMQPYKATFDRAAANAVIGVAAQEAIACGAGRVPTEMRVTFANDGTVMSVDAQGAGPLPSTMGACMESAFFRLRIPPFRGEAATVRVELPE